MTPDVAPRCGRHMRWRIMANRLRDKELRTEKIKHVPRLPPGVALVFLAMFHLLCQINTTICCQWLPACWQFVDRLDKTRIAVSGQATGAWLASIIVIMYNSIWRLDIIWDVPAAAAAAGWSRDKDQPDLLFSAIARWLVSKNGGLSSRGIFRRRIAVYVVGSWSCFHVLLC